MIRAAETGLVTFFCLTDLGASVSADINKAMNPSVATPGDQQGISITVCV
ncbi:MAG: hypothetical protein CM15mP125_2640 [Gammaproteobacteria bacterium]|nr:MAG: hypothetical protein CM15mP125_2640 [Gammaproteobacteria bacterium]